MLYYLLCKLLDRMHDWQSTTYLRWLATGDNVICRRCGKAIKNCKEIKI